MISLHRRQLTSATWMQSLRELPISGMLMSAMSAGRVILAPARPARHAAFRAPMRARLWVPRLQLGSCCGQTGAALVLPTVVIPEPGGKTPGGTGAP
jgi:hypothetical protein